MHGLRPEYQDRINFVILDYDVDEDLDLAREMEIPAHPAFTVVPPDSHPTAHIVHLFGPLTETRLRELIDEALVRFDAVTASMP